VTGAISPDEVKQMLAGLGFRDISIIPKTRSKEIVKSWNIGIGTENVVFSAYIKAIKPQIL
jgi:hypothetical protein